MSGNKEKNFVLQIPGCIPEILKTEEDDQRVNGETKSPEDTDKGG